MRVAAEFGLFEAGGEAGLLEIALVDREEGRGVGHHRGDADAKLGERIGRRRARGERQDQDRDEWGHTHFML